MQFLSRDYVASLPTEAIEALKIVCDDYKILDTAKKSEKFINLVGYLKFNIKELMQPTNSSLLSLLESLTDTYVKANNDTQNPQVITNFESLFKNVTLSHINHVADQQADYFKQLTNADGTGYTLGEGDCRKIQELINELRDTINADASIADEHKKRLLKKLNQLQTELNKEHPNYKEFWYYVMANIAYANAALIGAEPIINFLYKITDILIKPMSTLSGLPKGLNSKAILAPKDSADNANEDD